MRLVKFALNAYVAVAEPKGIERISLRCVNHILIPGTNVELADYFDFFPFVGPHLPEDYFDVICGMNAWFDEKRDILRNSPP